VKSAKQRKPKSSSKKPAVGKKRTGFTAEEKAAMKERVRELKAGKGGGESEVLAKIAKLPPTDRALAQQVHALIKAHAPSLEPKTWYGMPAYAKDGKTICFFQDAHKFKSRYAMLGFSDKAMLDDGNMWPAYYALKQLTPAEEARIVALLKKALD